ncbi:MAG: Na+ dependent nucleoside transporter N-terminal domain-containing protein, partial [Pseudomonadota bacterium]
MPRLASRDPFQLRGAAHKAADTAITSILYSLLGILCILGIAFLLSSGKKNINLRVVGAAFALQALMALLVLRTP